MKRFLALGLLATLTAQRNALEAAFLSEDERRDLREICAERSGVRAS